MKTTKRSKMLLSSVAMLLVALVALGSATFAWYTINRTVTAENAVVKAATPGGLDIKGASDADWGTSTSLASLNGTFSPASLTFGTAGVATAVNVDADEASSYAKDDSATITSVLNDDNYYKTATFQVRNGSAVAQTVTMDVTATTTTSNTFMNIAILKKLSTASDYSLVGVYKSAGTANGALTTSGTTSLTISDPATGLDSTSYAAGAIYDFIVVVYADGQNSNCKTTGADTANVEFDIEFNC